MPTGAPLILLLLPGGSDRVTDRRLAVPGLTLGGFALIRQALLALFFVLQPARAMKLPALLIGDWPTAAPGCGDRAEERRLPRGVNDLRPAQYSAPLPRASGDGGPPERVAACHCNT